MIDSILCKEGESLPGRRSGVACERQVVMVEGILDNAETRRSAGEIGDMFEVRVEPCGACWTLPVLARLNCSSQSKDPDGVTPF